MHNVCALGIETKGSSAPTLCMTVPDHDTDFRVISNWAVKCTPVADCIGTAEW